MFGILYLLLAVGIGIKLTEAFLFERDSAEQKTGSRLWLVMPASFGVGILLLTWAVYGTAWLLYVCIRVKEPLLAGNVLVMTAAAAWLIVSWKKRRIWDSNRPDSTASGGIWTSYARTLVRDKKEFCRELILFGILLAFLTWIMFYVFHIKDGVLYSGFTVYGDYAPHTAMMRSFSRENNYPTQYPHYGGADVKYHFMFQFLTGNLEYLGMRLDIAYNVVSILSLLGFLMLLYKLCRRLTGSFLGGALTSVLFFFRSGTAFFRFVWEHLMAGDLWQTLSANTAFIGYTPNEDWGLWCFNVYLNQRHLAFGLLLAALAVWVYLDWLKAGAAHESTGMLWMKERLFTKEAWRSRNLSKALLLGMLLGLCSFWNGAAVIGVLLILAGFGLFSDGKLDYAVTAFTAVVFSLLQSKIFISGSSMKPAFYFGFLAEDKNLWGVLWYLLQISGFYFLGFFVLLVFMKRRQRLAAVSFFLPAVFAFLVSLTPDINVNHKYIMISYAFLTIFWAAVLAELLNGKWLKKLLAAVLLVCLTATGIYDFAVILADNNAYHRVAVNMESELTGWLNENLDSEDLLLTPQYSMNEVTMSGEMLYCGWPYYAWSAGYDTNYRAAVAAEIYTTQNQEQLKRLVEQEKITYILFEEGSTFESQDCREDLLKNTYPLVYTSQEGRIRIYETGE